MFKIKPKTGWSAGEIIDNFMKRANKIDKLKSHGRPALPIELQHTDYNVMIDYADGPPICAGTDPAKITRSMAITLGKWNSPLNLLSGWWTSAPNKKNFIFSFSGKPSLDTICRFDLVLFAPFG
jgi:hypothetical protein